MFACFLVGLGGRNLTRLFRILGQRPGNRVLFVQPFAEIDEFAPAAAEWAEGPVEPIAHLFAGGTFGGSFLSHAKKITQSSRAAKIGKSLLEFIHPRR